MGQVPVKLQHLLAVTSMFRWKLRPSDSGVRLQASDGSTDF
jgi:hypothetical protein